MVASRSIGVGPMPLNSAKLPSSCRKNRSIGIMRSMAFSSAGGGGMLRLENACRSGRRSSSNVDQRAGIAADMAAIGQNLLIELIAQPLHRRAQICRS